MTRRLLVWLRARFGPRPIVAINGHFHADAAGGNKALREAGATVWASTLGARCLKQRGPSMVKMLRKMYPGVFDDLELAPPTKTFEAAKGLELDFGGDTVRVIYPGHAHSPDTVAIYLPQHEVIFGGCSIITGEKPGYVGAADLKSWPRFVEALRGLPARFIVPGHGDRFDRGLLDHTLEGLKRVPPQKAAPMTCEGD